MKVWQRLVVLFVLVAATSAKLNYKGHQVWRVSIENNNAHATQGIREVIDYFNLDVWASSTSYIDLRVKPENARLVGARLARQRLHWRTMIPDIGDLLNAEDERLAAKPHKFTLDDYNTFEQIEEYLKEVSTSNDYATLKSIGKSYEKRDLWQLKLSVGSGKPAVWIDCNIHAREWITGATCLYGIDYLLNSYGKDKDVTALMDKYDLYIMPINNPDGYSYTWTNDRMWRKNRDHYASDRCYGIDLNRNFDDHFGGAGTSPNSCTETYRGPTGASEPEIQATQNSMKDLIANADLKVLFSLHSYSQLWLYPFGYTYALPPEAKDLDRVAEIGVNALTAVHGTRYTYGPIAKTIYPAASNTIDYAYDQGIVYSYTMELRDTGRYGFLLPADQITPTAEETWAGLIAAILAI